MGDSQADSSVDASESNRDTSLIDTVDNDKPMGEIDNIDIDDDDKDKKDEKNNTFNHIQSPQSMYCVQSMKINPRWPNRT